MMADMARKEADHQSSCKVSALTKHAVRRYCIEELVIYKSND